MAKCKLCKTDIPNEKEYCENCMEEKAVKTKEAYLDSLLSSVANSAPVANHIYKRNQNVNLSQDDNSLYHEDANKSSTDSLDNSERKEDLMNKDIPLEDEDALFANDFFEDEDSLFVDTLSENDLTEDFSLENIDLDDLEEFNDLDINEDLEETVIISDHELFGESLSPETELDFMQDNLMEDTQKSMDSIADILEAESQPEENIDNEFIDFMPQESGFAEEGYDPAIGDLLSGLDLEEDILSDNIQDVFDDESNTDGALETIQSDTDELESNETMEEDFLSLLSQFSDDDPVAADVQAISDMLQGNSRNDTTEEIFPSDVGEVFSEALKAVTSLEDMDIDDISQLYQDADQNKVQSKKKSGKKAKQNSQNKNLNKKGFFASIFGNVVDEDAAKKKSSSEETAATMAQDSKKAKSKKKGRKKDTSPVDLDLEDGSIRNVQESGKQDDKKAKKVKEKKSKEKKVKEKKPKKEAIEIIEDYDDEFNRINPVGASIVFAFFGLLVIILLIGTNVFSYSLSIKNAKTHFSRHEYTEAYNQVYGVDIKDEDIEIYDKIMTVMFVNKQLNSYNNFYGMKKYPEALDSLLKGLSRYDKYIELATILGIKSDLDYVRDQILTELELVFDLTEKEAISIINSDSQIDYTVAVHDTILANMTH